MTIHSELPISSVERALRRVRSRTGVSLAFGGPVLKSGNLALQHFDGPILGALPGVTLPYDVGLGGKAVALRRPIGVADYFASERISHQYDRVIQAEGLRSLVAAPVIVGQEIIGVLYAAFRNNEVVGDRIATSLLEEVRALEHEIVTLTTLRARDQSDSRTDHGRLQEQVRDAHSELRALSSTVEEPQLRAALRAIADKLSTTPPTGPKMDRFTQRETDVLALVGAGMTNKGIAERLGLTLFTVKGYVKVIMSKLQATTRYEAVITARRLGYLP